MYFCLFCFIFFIKNFHKKFWKKRISGFYTVILPPEKEAVEKMTSADLVSYCSGNKMARSSSIIFRVAKLKIQISKIFLFWNEPKIEVIFPPTHNL